MEVGVCVRGRNVVVVIFLSQMTGLFSRSPCSARAYGLGAAAVGNERERKKTEVYLDDTQKEIPYSKSNHCLRCETCTYSYNERNGHCYPVLLSIYTVPKAVGLDWIGSHYGVCKIRPNNQSNQSIDSLSLPYSFPIDLIQMRKRPALYIISYHSYIYVCVFVS